MWPLPQDNRDSTYLLSESLTRYEQSKLKLAPPAQRLFMHAKSRQFARSLKDLGMIHRVEKILISLNIVTLIADVLVILIEVDILEILSG